MTKVNYDITKQMRMDLMMAYAAVAHTCLTKEQAFKHAVLHPAPRFYITRKQAYQVISRMIRGDFSQVDKFDNNRKRMYYELFDRTQEAIQKRGYKGKSLYYIMQFIVIQPAPEFYLSWRTFEKIFMFMKEGRFENTQNWAKWKLHYDPSKPKPIYDWRRGVRIC